MRIIQTIGNVTLSRCHPSLRGARWLVGVPLSTGALAGGDGRRGEPFVIYDELGAHRDALIGVSEGAEASAPFHPDVKPIDAYNSAILDTVSIS